MRFSHLQNWHFFPDRDRDVQLVCELAQLSNYAFSIRTNMKCRTYNVWKTVQKWPLWKRDAGEGKRNIKQKLVRSLAKAFLLPNLSGFFTLCVHSYIINVTVSLIIHPNNNGYCSHRITIRVEVLHAYIQYRRLAIPHKTSSWSLRGRIIHVCTFPADLR